MTTLLPIFSNSQRFQRAISDKPTFDSYTDDKQSFQAAPCTVTEYADGIQIHRSLAGSDIFYHHPSLKLTDAVWQVTLHTAQCTASHRPCTSISTAQNIIK